MDLNGNEMDPGEPIKCDGERSDVDQEIKQPPRATESSGARREVFGKEADGTAATRRRRDGVRHSFLLAVSDLGRSPIAVRSVRLNRSRLTSRPGAAAVRRRPAWRRGANLGRRRSRMASVEMFFEFWLCVQGKIIRHKIRIQFFYENGAEMSIVASVKV